MNTHTPVPWEHQEDSSAITAGGYVVAVAYGENEHANAELVVKAVNCHDDMLAALDEVYDALVESHDTAPFMQAVRWAILKAKGHI